MNRVAVVTVRQLFLVLALAELVELLAEVV
jgi:hypothetical protein